MRWLKNVAAPAVVIIFSLWRVIGQVSNLEFALTASGNPHMVAAWNFLTSPAGNLVVLCTGLCWIAFVVVRELRNNAAASSPAALNHAAVERHTSSEDEVRLEVQRQAKPNIVLSKTDIMLIEKAYGRIAVTTNSSSNNPDTGAVATFRNMLSQDAPVSAKDVRARIEYFHNDTGISQAIVEIGNWTQHGEKTVLHPGGVDHLVFCCWLSRPRAPYTIDLAHGSPTFEGLPLREYDVAITLTSISPVSFCKTFHLNFNPELPEDAAHCRAGPDACAFCREHGVSS